MLGSKLIHVCWVRVAFFYLLVAMAQLQQPLCVLSVTMEEEMRGQRTPSPSLVQCDSCRSPGQEEPVIHL